MNLETQPDAGEIEIYHYCTAVDATSTLCGKCPIPKQIEAALPRMIAEIETRRLADTRAGFKRYCRKQLTFHASKAADWANQLANPVLRNFTGIKVPDALSRKFWNLAVCELYKKEIEPPRPAAPLPTLAAPVGPAVSAGPATPPAAPTTPQPVAPYTWADIDALAEAVGLTKAGKYTLGDKFKSAVTGFAEALVRAELLTKVGAGLLNQSFGQRYGVSVKTDRTTKARTDYEKKTRAEVARRYPTSKPRFSL